jgi:hypothetical protein
MKFATPVKKSLVYLALIIFLALITCRPSADPEMEKPANAARPCQPRITLIGDSSLFIAMARHPMMLFERNNARQNRPSYIFCAAALNYLIKNIFSSLGLDLGDISAYLAYIFINFAALFLALILFDRLLIPAEAAMPFTIIALSVNLLINNVAIVYLWYPHTQIFNIFLPIFLIALSRTILESPDLLLKRFISAGILLGILCTFYGSFILALPVMLISYSVSYRMKEKKNMPPLEAGPSTAVKIAVMAMLIVLPTLVWVIITILATGRYYNLEIAHHRQFIWVWDALKEGGIVNLWRICLYDTIPGYLRLMGTITWKYLLLLTASLIVFRSMGMRMKDISRANKLNITASLLCIVPIAIFFYLQNFYRERLLWNIIPPFLVIAGALLLEVTSRVGRKKRFLINGAVLLTALAPLAISQKTILSLFFCQTK